MRIVVNQEPTIGEGMTADRGRAQVPAAAAGRERAGPVHPVHGRLHILRAGQRRAHRRQALQARHHVCHGGLPLSGCANTALVACVSKHGKVPAKIRPVYQHTVSVDNSMYLVLPP